MDLTESGTEPVDINIDELFSAYFPLPYRVISTLLIGIWAWGLSLYILSAVRIDVESLLRFNVQHAGPPLYKSVFQIGTVLTLIYSVNGVLYWISGYTRTVFHVLGVDLFPLLCFFTIPIVFFYPGIAFRQSGRYRFLRTLRRISIGGLDRESRFADVLAADALTSYTKVLGDVWIMSCMLTSRRSIAEIPDRTCGGRLVVPIIISVPYAIRLRQCLIDYIRSGGQQRVHLLNAAKYSTTFPVIFLSVFQRSIGFEKLGVYHLWVLSMIVNSVYSFYWDVAMDWDLTLFETSVKSSSNRGLRSILHFPPSFYYAAIGLDFILRFTWSLKLSPHLYFLNDFEGGVFVLEVLELLRRWIWLVLRIETEWIRTTSSGRLPVSDVPMVHEAKD
ncbi:EXS family-domain-containing protein [Lipomyces arxii]|uniref:EXS family-domain-containing protein n=1 Tax=Lipomyces arxii TaxID=56418 RepID=UPI0034CE90BB